MKKAVRRARAREDLLEAARSGRELVISPLKAAEWAQLLDGVGMINLYLESAVRQAGGQIHLDTATIVRSTGTAWRYQADHAAGHGGLLFLEEA